MFLYGDDKGVNGIAYSTGYSRVSIGYIVVGLDGFRSLEVGVVRIS